MVSDAFIRVRELVLMVTRERDIAAQAQRAVTLLNGLISSDTVSEAA